MTLEDTIAIQDEYNSKVEGEWQHKVACMNMRHLPIGASIVSKRYWEPIFISNNQKLTLFYEEWHNIRVEELKWMNRVVVVLKFLPDCNMSSMCLNFDECMAFNHFGSETTSFLFDPGGKFYLPGNWGFEHHHPFYSITTSTSFSGYPGGIVFHALAWGTHLLMEFLVKLTSFGIVLKLVSSAPHVMVFDRGCERRKVDSKDSSFPSKLIKNQVQVPYWQNSISGNFAKVADVSSYITTMKIVATGPGVLHHVKNCEAYEVFNVNDIVLVIMELLETHQRALCVNTDIHHGDGDKETIFTTYRGMKDSFDNFGDYFPCTGDGCDIKYVELLRPGGSTIRNMVSCWCCEIEVALLEISSMIKLLLVQGWRKRNPVVVAENVKGQELIVGLDKAAVVVLVGVISTFVAYPLDVYCSRLTFEPRYNATTQDVLNI